MGGGVGAQREERGLLADKGGEAIPSSWDEENNLSCGVLLTRVDMTVLFSC